MNDSDRGTPVRPLVGLTTYLQRAQTGVWDTEAAFLPACYARGVSAAGGTAVLLPPQPVAADTAARLIDRLDALVLTGGGDVDPAGYGQPAHAETDPPNPLRDGFETALLDAALRRGLPVLGICRGAQLLNVARGGTLHQHLPDVFGHGGHRLGDAVFAEQQITTVAGTRTAALLGTETTARCYHHQGIAELGARLVVSARGADGVIEAIEDPGAAFVLAVQWHPEEDLDDLRLFTGLIAAARAYATDREGR